MFIFSKKGSTLFLIGLLFGLMGPLDATEPDGPKYINCYHCKNPEEVTCRPIEHRPCPEGVNTCYVHFGPQSFPDNVVKNVTKRGCGDVDDHTYECTTDESTGWIYCTCCMTAFRNAGCNEGGIDGVMAMIEAEGIETGTCPKIGGPDPPIPTI